MIRGLFHFAMVERKTRRCAALGPFAARLCRDHAQDRGSGIRFAGLGHMARCRQLGRDIPQRELPTVHGVARSASSPAAPESRVNDSLSERSLQACKARCIVASPTRYSWASCAIVAPEAYRSAITRRWPTSRREGLRAPLSLIWLRTRKLSMISKCIDSNLRLSSCPSPPTIKRKRDRHDAAIYKRQRTDTLGNRCRRAAS